MQCSRCNVMSSLSSDDYCSATLTPDKNGGYIISKFEAKKNLGSAYLYIPSIPDADIKFSGITVTQSDGKFEAINIPEGIEKLGASGIYLSDSFKVLVLPSTLKEIEDSAFYGNGTPSVIFYNGSEEDWKKIELGGYSSLWADTEIIFCPDGVTHDDVATRLFLSCDIEKAVAKQKQMILTSDAAREAAKKDAVSLISEEKIAFVAYDEENSLVAYCGVPSGFKTRIEIYDLKAGKITASFEVNDHIDTLDIREGYVAMGGYYSSTVYVYDISAKETAKFKIESDSPSDSISQVFIDSGYVYASTGESHYVAAYSIRSSELTVILQISQLDYLIMNHDHHRLIAVEKYYSQIYFDLIDTEKAAYIKEITFSEHTTSSLVKIPHFENVIATKDGLIYDFDGNITTEKPLNTPSVKATVPEGLPVVSKLYEHIDGAMTLFAESGTKVLLALQNAVSGEPLILNYYAEEAIVTAEGDMIIYTPGYCGLLLVKLN